MQHNPFEILENKLIRIEKLLEQIQNTKIELKPESSNFVFNYISIKDILDRKICSRFTLYSRIKTGVLPLYKFGNRSFIHVTDFEQAFHKVKRNKLN